MRSAAGLTSSGAGSPRPILPIRREGDGIVCEFGGRLKSDPNRSSLGLLPSGPDPVGEWLVHRQPPRLYIGRNGRKGKDGPICYRAPDIRPGSWGQPQSIVVLVTRTISVARRKPWREGAFPPQRLVSRQRLRLIGQI